MSQQGEGHTSFAVYGSRDMAMKVHLQIGPESLIDAIHQQGLCMSYNHLRVLGKDIVNSVICH